MKEKDKLTRKTNALFRCSEQLIPAKHTDSMPWSSMHELQGHIFPFIKKISNIKLLHYYSMSTAGVNYYFAPSNYKFR